MTCKDCLSENVCAMSPIREKYSDIKIEEICEHFKNKSDFVEVVRCKDCSYCDEEGRCEAPENGLIREYVNADDFCSYGERK